MRICACVRACVRMCECVRPRARVTHPRNANTRARHMKRHMPNTETRTQHRDTHLLPALQALHVVTALDHGRNSLPVLAIILLHRVTKDLGGGGGGARARACVCVCARARGFRAHFGVSEGFGLHLCVHLCRRCEYSVFRPVCVGRFRVALGAHVSVWVPAFEFIHTEGLLNLN